MLVTYTEPPAYSINLFYLPRIIVIMNVMILSQYSAKTPIGILRRVL